MATYPVKMLKDEEGKPFVPLISIDSIKEVGGETLEQQLDKKLETTNIIAGTQIALEVEGNNVIISNSAEGTKLINNLDQTAVGVGALDAAQGKVLKESIPEVINNLTTIDSKKALSAHQGYVLAGRSVPVGGGTGQVLMKSADDDYSLTWGDAADPNAIVGDGSIKKIVELTYNEYIALEEAGQLEDTTEYHISDWNENERTYLTTEDIKEIVDQETNTKFDLKYGPQIPDGTDLNTMITPGVYRSSTTAKTQSLLNIPPGVTSGGFTLSVLQYYSESDTSKFIRQEFIAGRLTAVRRTQDRGTTWSDWQIVGGYKIGDIFITSTNSSPGDIMGGTWSLINKEFSSYMYAPTDPTPYFTPTENASLTSVAFVRNGNGLSIRIGLKPLVALGDTQVNLGQVNMDAFGITRFPLTRYGQLAGSDTGEGAVMYNITYEGVINSIDFLPIADGGTMPADTSSIYIEQTYIFNHTYMTDDVCNKFYWKRTA